MKAVDIKKLLAIRHNEDLFYCEVKTGSSWFDKIYIIDALAMKKSWVKFGITGYEIKVSRSDFLRDKKWHNYLNYCNEFYFVVPKGLIDKSELPDNVGLIYCTENATRKVKSATRKEVEKTKVSDMIFHLLMKYNIKDQYPFHSSKKEYWKHWLNDKIDSRELSLLIKTKMTEKLRDSEIMVAESLTKVNKYNKISELFKKYDIPTRYYLETIEELFKGNNLRDSEKT